MVVITYKEIGLLILSILWLLSCKGQTIDAIALTSKENPSLEEIQIAVEYNLIKARIYESEKYQIPYPFQYDYFTEKARLRLLELLKNKWTEKEIESNLKPSFLRLYDTLNSAKGFYNNVKKIAKRDSLPISRVFDSMIEVRKDIYRNRIINTKIDINLVMKAAYLRDKRFIPYIKELLNDPKYYSKDELRLALARYGIEPYHSEVIEENSFENFKKTQDPTYLFNVYGKFSTKLYYICSKKSVDELLKFIDTTERVYEPSFDAYMDYIARSPIAILSWILKNQELERELSELRDIGIKEESLEAARKLVKKYYQNYTMDDIDCQKTPLEQGW